MVGLLSLKEGSNYFTLNFADQGWLGADLLQYLDDILEAHDRPVQILKLLGITMAVSSEKPDRRLGHWVIVDLDGRSLETNSEWIRKAVDQKPPDRRSPIDANALKRIHDILDRYDFTVTFYS